MDPDTYDIVVRRLRAAGASREDAEDCAQEALLSAWSAVSSGRPIGDVLAWTTTVARRRHVDAVRRAYLERARRLPPGEHDRTDPTPEQRVVEREHARWLAATVQDLPESTQEVCAQAAAGNTRTAIAKHLGISQRSAESHLTRARRLLRAKATIVWAAFAVGTSRVLRGVNTAKATAIVATAVTAAVSVMPTDTAQPPAASAIDPQQRERRISEAAERATSAAAGVDRPSQADLATPGANAGSQRPGAPSPARVNAAPPITPPVRKPPRSQIGPPPERLRHTVTNTLHDVAELESEVSPPAVAPVTSLADGDP